MADFLLFDQIVVKQEKQRRSGAAKPRLVPAPKPKESSRSLAIIEELCEFMSARYGLGGLKIAVLAISLLCFVEQIKRSLPGEIA